MPAVTAWENNSSIKNVYKPYSMRPVAKEVQKRLVLVDYQGDSPGEVVVLLELPEAL